jgi:hypothetical protein
MRAIMGVVWFVPSVAEGEKDNSYNENVIFVAITTAEFLETRRNCIVDGLQNELLEENLNEVYHDIF